MARAKAIVLIQGINKDAGYLETELDNYPSLLKNYKLKKQIQTEKEFDKHLAFRIPFLGKILKKSFTFGALGDFWQFLRGRDTRKRICKRIRSDIKNLQRQGYNVDILAHSLGTIMTLVAGPHDKDDNRSTNNSPLNVNSCYFFGSPLGFKLPYVEWRTERFVKKYSDNFRGKKLYYFYSSKDPVCSSVDKTDKKILESLFDEVIYIKTKATHKTKDYLSELKGSYNVIKPYE